jgi:hypothetical protein
MMVRSCICSSGVTDLAQPVGTVERRTLSGLFLSQTVDPLNYDGYTAERQSGLGVGQPNARGEAV